MTTYDELKRGLLDIASILEKFPPDIQGRVFDLLTAAFTGDSVRSLAPAPSSGVSSHTVADPGKPRRKPGTKENISLVKDLDLRGSGNVPSLRDFVAQKQPASNIEFTAVAVYYLAKLREVNAISPAHINTCYKEADRRPPGNFKQNLWDTSSSKYGYIDVADMEKITLPLRGSTFVEHDLPRAAAAKK